jgi:hypothetical protein
MNAELASISFETTTSIEATLFKSAGAALGDLATACDVSRKQPRTAE